MRWPFVLIVIIPAPLKDLAEQVASGIEPDPSCGGPHFTIPLSASGGKPETHWATCTQVTDEMTSLLAAEQERVPELMYWRMAADGSLVASNATPASGQAWSVAASLHACGLRHIEPSGPPR